MKEGEILTVPHDRLEDAHRLVYKFMQVKDVSPSDYTYEKYVDYMVEKHGIAVKKVDFGDYLNTILDGVIIGTRNKWRIHINKSMLNTRQNFTLCHELSHYIWDCDYGKKIDKITSLSGNNKSEYESQSDTEFLANTSAGVMMIPDMSIRNSFEEKLTFGKMTSKFKISASALNYRLIQFLVYYTGCPVIHAQEIVCKFRYNSDPEDFLFLIKSGLFNTDYKVDTLFLNSVV